MEEGLGRRARKRVIGNRRAELGPALGRDVLDQGTWGIRASEIRAQVTTGLEIKGLEITDLEIKGLEIMCSGRKGQEITATGKTFSERTCSANRGSVIRAPRSRLGTGPLEDSWLRVRVFQKLRLRHRCPTGSLLEKTEFATLPTAHAGLGVAALQQESGDQGCGPGRGDVSHRHIDPLPQHPRLEQTTRLEAGGSHLAVVGLPGGRAGGSRPWRHHPQQQNHSPRTRHASDQAPSC